MDALFVIVPISLIIMLLVDFFKAVVSDDDTAKKKFQNGWKKNNKCNVNILCSMDSKCNNDDP